MADVIELADLHSLLITFWIGQHYLDTTGARTTPLLHPYRVQQLPGAGAHVALCHMRTAPPAVSAIPHAPCTLLDAHLGCGVMPLSVIQQSVSIFSLFISNPLLGGAKRTRPTAQLDGISTPITIRVPQHAVAEA